MPASGSRTRTETQVSAGGVAYRTVADVPEIALISVGTSPRWQLPKGLIDAGENAETAAVREVREEAGIEAEIVASIDKVEYWYQTSRGGEHIRYHKFVYFFLMRYVSGDVTNHDTEVIEAGWFPLRAALSQLAFRSERTIVEKAAEMLQHDEGAQ